MRRTTILLLLYLFIHPVIGLAQFRLMRFDENYSGYKDSARSFYNSIKYIPLARSGNNIYMSVGGEARMEFVYFNNEDWGRLGIGSNPFFLQRYDVHADVHLGPKVRVFGQIRSAWESGRKNGPRPIDEDHLNIQNLFVDVDVVKNEKEKLTVRAGRQELDYGSGRLISVREGPNLRLYFDGARLMYQKGNFKSDVFVLMADTVNTGAFDNRSSKAVNLWGTYNTIIFPRSGNLELYYLGIRRKNSVFEEGMADETRHSIGGRFFRYGGGFIYNFEGLYQFGKFGSGDISAWTASADIGYLFEHVNGKPSINLRNDYISGDGHRGDGKLQSFNPLYPKGGYFGFSPQIGPVNLIDIHPYATLNPWQKVFVQADVVMNWRYSISDGVYRPSGNFNLAGSSSSKRYIGTAYLFSIAYTINKFVSINTGIQYFKTGAFVRDLISTPKDGLFMNTRLAVKF
ncbi:alginate export family protein [Chitinophaga ginsengisoli]|uniref:Alginate export protein n=1 Tax=Chitinophaga ginsengisoli TaxID=363837 RepID=A0A2P8GAR1_9BACT|nr:alginate export family protein [Chitinophaga ginsengisoli]PSL31028.1 alginate export protein [Chitinophaga ginsengisoli]